MLKLNKKLNRLSAVVSASFVAGLISSSESAYAASGESFNSISQRLTSNISGLPGLLTALSYVFGLLLAILGLIKIKDHVENPSQTPLKEGAIRLCIGGALFAIPTFTTAMQNLLGNSSASIDAGATKMKAISSFNDVST